MNGPTDAHGHSSDNRDEIERSSVCGCFHCLEVFPPEAIHQWCDEGATARCPRCGIDSVVGDASGMAVTGALLLEMRQRWF